MKKMIVGIGEILWDMLPSGKVIGGAPANFVYHTQEFGESSVIVSCVGNDDLGREIIASLKNINMFIGNNTTLLVVVCDNILFKLSKNLTSINFESSSNIIIQLSLTLFIASFRYKL